MNLRVNLIGQVREKWVAVARMPEFAGASNAVIINQLLISYLSKQIDEPQKTPVRFVKSTFDNFDNFDDA